ncbi:CDP-alcohol phosphatidyltransferase family protein [Pararhodobacter oceanensis]|uniref:CDP-alcohol phosphatidyltransferase family protein n=1 Tax=Pararhodobacter oceanensis TaxID=2172121 RepID=UPI003A94C4EB
MLDRYVRPLIDPPLNRAGRMIAQVRISANMMTTFGWVLGILAAVAIAQHSYWLALALVLASRLADGLDGAVARATQLSDFGGYYDIVADFVFYAAIPMGFIWADPAANGIAGGALLTAFYINGATFLGYAILAAKRNLTTSARGEKSWYHVGGLLEGTETIVFFVALCLFPGWFVPLAWVFALLCVLGAAARIMMARQVMRD